MAVIAELDIALKQDAADWKQAIALAGVLLTRGGHATDQYTAEMIRTVEELGPYIVIAPGFALAHSRPSPSVLGPGLSLVTLRTPVEFGSAANDPVDIVVGLCSLDHVSHVERLAALAGYLGSDGSMEFLRSATDPGAVAASLNDFNESGAKK
ncbi:PTS sugar transporter subunit IIA [Tsukamurella spumae]|uniref:Ascorbate-specific PTS system EIIA component n=1 Tax=Tsukamurella spumae TaxID=44753 RepID=A0A846X6K2_9ACTN|nr:PTS sugar transporter subunit IIA [Tsukamurella spumae]NKY20723.1 PTS sugar transporter subunit IIA [Tsukamurella spumae]